MTRVREIPEYTYIIANIFTKINILVESFDGEIFGGISFGAFSDSEICGVVKNTNGVFYNNPQVKHQN